MHHSGILRLVRSGITPILALVLAGALACVQAAELGDIQVRSYIGQPLVADIELTALGEAGAKVQVRLADPDVWRGANVRMHPVLSDLSLSVMRRDGRQFLHITSVKPVESDYVHLFLTLGEGGRREVRAATLWLSPDPQPAPPPPPVPAPMPAPAPVPPTAPAPPAARNVHAQAAVSAPLAPHQVRVLHLPSAPASCPQQFSDEQIKICAALDHKNGVLTAKIVELEEKVKLLQLGIEHKDATAGSHTQAASAPPVLSRAALAKKNAAAAKNGEGLPWMLIGGAAGALVVVALAVWFLLRHRKRKAALPVAAAAPKTGMLAGLTARFKRKPAVAAPVAHVEPDAG
ncbi:type IV pilus assembly protein FimV [Massilia antarctica]|uniref:type IV pilus assembly protein FimV n=1 Tax=Massilia antarctica TaxID=2765360 RepID=UPI0006BD1999|nr:hypothetical protein [Massilia sp. H27-R4]MCY0914865.1 hypothetical protein [Massilia sp. H27-R4]CUI08088.1 Probable type iv pilus assembly fimv-related transmembrane protein [Janthinobacterium sp. CG23_2]CUU31874.1 Probable type iv pilus assembly fimv-related transmembrane protein [Janthinobacterium sp. CG23_2]